MPNDAITKLHLFCPTTSRPPEAVKIGEVAGKLRTSTHAIRRYEREGLLIPFRSPAGTRWYGLEDMDWIRTIRSLLEQGLNFAGIRCLLAQIPCWALRPCTNEERESCVMAVMATAPCWSASERVCPEELQDCYQCPAYRRAKDFVNLKAVADIVPLHLY